MLDVSGPDVSRSKVITMTEPGRAPTEAQRGAGWLSAVRARLRDPAVLTIIAVAFFISAIGQAVLQAYVHDDSVIMTTVLSVVGSVFVAAAIIVAARREEQATRRQRPNDPDAR
jgi:hypothetical protein